MSIVLCRHLGQVCLIVSAVLRIADIETTWTPRKSLALPACVVIMFQILLARIFVALVLVECFPDFSGRVIRGRKARVWHHPAARLTSPCRKCRSHTSARGIVLAVFDHPVPARLQYTVLPNSELRSAITLVMD